MEDYKSITIISGKIHNPTSYKLIGRGAQGAVFKLSDKRCVKIYAKARHAERERKVLQAAEGSPYFPKLYETGSHYNVMEFIEGSTLDKYLEAHRTFPSGIAYQLVEIFKEMKRLNFSRLDARLRHIIITGKRKVKVIDHVNSFKKHEKLPAHMLHGLKKIGAADEFLGKVSKIDHKLYTEWKDYLARK